MTFRRLSTRLASGQRAKGEYKGLMAGLGDLLSTNEFMPHGMCYEWDPKVIGLHVVSDALIALAYYSIPLTLVYLVRRRKDLVFDWIFLCFAAFIVACGTTHLMEIYNIWHPTYWLSGAIKAITAAVSIVTAILLMRLVPKALALPSPTQLRNANDSLRTEIKERTMAVERAESLNNKLATQASQLEESNQELEAFAYSVSHDLRAPLRHIDGYVDLLKAESPLNEDGTRYAKVISDSARQMGALIDDLLAFSRMGRAALLPASVDMNELVEEVRERLKPDEAGREIIWKVAPLPVVIADRNLFRQVWLNLLGNAIKYSRNRERAEITIGFRKLEREHEFFVQDNGAGFDMKYADKLFGIFQRLHFKEEFEGTGIGLANVRRIVSRHGGRTWGEGEPQVGATFFFTLPIHSILEVTA
jgi:signal transduction histidine kinase